MSSNWIPVAVKTPAPWADVLIALSNGRVVVGTFLGTRVGAWDWAQSDDDADMESAVTHWMHFPAHPASPTSAEGKP